MRCTKPDAKTFHRDRYDRHCWAISSLIILLSVSSFQFPALAEEQRIAANHQQPVDFAGLWLGQTVYTESEILAMLKNEEPLKRQFAVLQLAEHHYITKKSLAALVEALSDKDENVRFQALAGLMRIGKSATQILVNTLTDTETVIGTKNQSSYYEPVTKSDLAFTALRYAQSLDTDYLLKKYSSHHTSAKKHFRKLLNEVPVQLTPTLYAALQSKDPELAVTVAKIIGRAGANAKVAVPLLVQAVAEGDDSVRKAAAFALSKIPVQGENALRQLITVKNAKTRMFALSAYLKLADDANLLIPQYLKDPDPQVRHTAFDVYSINADDAAKVITEFLKDSSSQNQLAALNKARSFIGYRYRSTCKPIDAKSVTRSLDLSETAFEDIILLSNHPKSKVRISAIAALGALGCVQTDLAPTIVNHIMTLISGPDDTVTTQAISQLAALAKQGVVPQSDNSTEIIIAALENSEFPNNKGKLLSILKMMQLPEIPDHGLINELLNACKTRYYTCQDANTILQSYPSWSIIAVKTLMERYPKLQDFDEEALTILTQIQTEAPVDSAVLEYLLLHPEANIRVKAAIQLTKLDFTSERVLDILEKAVRTAKRIDYDAVDALVAMGQLGIESLFLIIQDPAANLQSRQTLLNNYNLSRADNKNPFVQDKLIEIAENSSAPDLQKLAIRKLGYLSSRQEMVQSVLETAFSSKNAHVRQAVTIAWANSALAAVHLIDRAAHDPDAMVRIATFRLLKQLPDSDPRQLSITRAALADENTGLRSTGLKYTAKIGDTGRQLLKEYAEQGRPLSSHFFYAVRQLKPLSPPLIAALEDRAVNATPELIVKINQALGKESKIKPLDKTQLYAQLHHDNARIRKSAAEALLDLNEDPWAHNGLIAAVLMDAKVRSIIKKRIIETLYPYGLTSGYSNYSHYSSYSYNPGFLTYDSLTIGGEVALSFDSYHKPLLPKIPWPPPAGYSRVVVPRKLFMINENSNFGDIYSKLVTALEAASDGFEHGLFQGVPGGFALVARMERINPDGTPLPGPARWLKQGSPKLSLMDFLGDLFFEKPGYFRVIVFAVTNDIVPGEDVNARLPEPIEGAATIPRALAEKPFDDQEVIALIYAFARHQNAKVTPWKEGAPSAKQHIKRAGVWEYLVSGAANP